MNLVTKMVVRRDKRQPTELTWRFCIKPIFESVYLKEVELTMMKSYKSISNEFVCKKVT